MKKRNKKEKGMTYSGVGVDYKAMDPVKRAMQEAARKTAGNISRFENGQFREFEASRRESAYLIETLTAYLAHVEEGLGTKNLVAEVMYKYTGKSYYDHIAQDTVAMIVNDMITVGALPLSVAMHLAVGESSWFDDETRYNDLIEGWKKACNLARCAWGGGETSTLKDIIVEGRAELSGSAMGFVQPKERLVTANNIQNGDAIVLVESSGIHANGLAMARDIAKDNLSNGYLTQLDSGRTYGDTLLDPTHIYVPLVERCLDQGVDVHYIVNITGHGWRKLMRAKQPFTYVIDKLPEPPLIFDFLQRHGPVNDREAYGNFNMGAGFAFYVPEDEVDAVVKIANSHNFNAFRAGYIEQSSEKRVFIKPKNLEYSALTLKIR